ncbi:MAG: hypothetical protein M1818_003212 [Claussenomyces sp. TS43310]|nr:MAG: hypothetical protein M1818_003212 [Claussenomyces sp. TS43310]
MPPRLSTSVPRAVHPSSQTCSAHVRMPSGALRVFSSTARQSTRQRRSMWMWLNNEGSQFYNPLPGTTNYLQAWDTGRRVPDSGSENATEPDAKTRTETPSLGFEVRPFPLNLSFKSQRVTSEGLREAIWQRVMRDGQSVKRVSGEWGVEMSRVGAIVRLKEVEKEWIRKGRSLAKPYAKAVLSMLPQTPRRPEGERQEPHESINDLPVHGATVQQIFHPTSESRHFTRVDAARVFDEALLPTDERVPHPELAELEKDRLSGVDYDSRMNAASKRHDEAQERKLLAERQRREREAKALKVVDSGRWQFTFREVSVDDAGVDGRGPRGTGWRYGVPHMDRRRGQVKIPTRVV